MENRKRSSAWNKSCKKHPQHQQSPGVCSLCLRERLSKISSSSSRAVTSVSSSSSSSSISSVSSVSSSNGASYTSSPMHSYRNQRKNYGVEEGRGYLSFLRKSRSLVFGRESVVEIDVKEKKSYGFWSKLMGSKRSNTQKRSMEEAGSSSRLMHSKTMREMLTRRV